jgi:hypothetical protein
MRPIAALVCFAAAAPAALQTLHVQERGDYANARQFGEAGVYERITAIGTNEQGQTVSIEMIRPRDPAKGTQTLVVMGPGQTANLEPLMQKGMHLLRIENAQSPEAIRDLLGFLRYGGKPLLLSDSRRFVKQVLAHVPANAHAGFRKAVDPAFRDPENRQVVDKQHTSDLKALAASGQP